MTTSTASPNDHSSDQLGNQPRKHFGGKGGKWSGINIAGMVLGFILFWPIGLFILFWILSGRSIKALPEKVRSLWVSMTNWGDRHSINHSSNVVMNEYQQTQYDRIQEIKEEIKERSQRFKHFKDDARRRADQEEFNHFMASTPGNVQS